MFGTSGGTKFNGARDSPFAELLVQHLVRRCGRSLRSPRDGDGNVTTPAEQSIVVEPAFAAAVSHRHNVIRFPSWADGSPRFSRGAVACWRLGSRPLPVRLHDVETADLTDSLVAFLDLPTDIPGTAANLPFVDARVAAECATRWCDGSMAPAANGLSGRIAIRFAPLFGSYDARAAGAHAWRYRAFPDRTVGPEPHAGKTYTPIINDSANLASQSIH
jgi:hypothetical protein